MTNEEAKALYIDAVKLFEAKDYTSALEKFEQLDAERPNSRHVTYHRCVCLAHLDRKDEAREEFAKIDGKLEREKNVELRKLLAPAAPPAEEVPMAMPSSDLADTAAGGNVLVIETAIAKSTDETTITGHIKSGAFRTGDSLTLLTESGMPIVAPIIRIGTAETPLKMARAGQKALMLLQVESHHVVPGSSATCVSQEESYAETMVVGMSDEASASTASHMGGPLLELDRRMKTGDFAGAREKLEAYLQEQPDSCAAHRLMARLYLDGGDAIRDNKKALEHVRRAYELGGAEDPVVVDTLAQAMAANGEAEHGLRFLERLYTGTREFEAKGALSQRIIEFRTRHQLGHTWEFADNYGDVIFEAREIPEIVRAIKNGTVPKTALCKKDHVGEWRKLEETIAVEYPEIGALFAEQSRGGGNSMLLYVIIAVLAALIVIVMINLMGSGGTPEG